MGGQIIQCFHCPPFVYCRIGCCLHAPGLLYRRISQLVAGSIKRCHHFPDDGQSVLLNMHSNRCELFYWWYGPLSHSTQKDNLSGIRHGHYYCKSYVSMGSDFLILWLLRRPLTLRLGMVVLCSKLNVVLPCKGELQIKA